MENKNKLPQGEDIFLAVFIISIAVVSVWILTLAYGLTGGS